MIKFSLIHLSFFLSLFFSCSCEEAPIVEVQQETLNWQAGKNEYNMNIGGYERNFLIHVPTSYVEGEDIPVVFMLHGSSGTGTKFYNISGWKEKGEAENILTIFPTAMEYRLDIGRSSTKWSSAGLEMELAEGEELKDDIPFFEELLVLLKTSFSIDEKRIYTCGCSNGSGFIKTEIVPRMGDSFAAANVTGGVGIPISFPIEGNRFMPVFNISGSKDAKIVERLGGEELPLSAGALEANEILWDDITTFCDMLGLSTAYTELPNAPQWNLLVFDNSIKSTATEYRFMMVKGMEHVYPNGNNNPRGVVAVDVLWPWFLEHALN